MKNMKKLISMALVLVMAMALLAGCGSDSSKTEDSAKDSGSKDVLIMATNAAFPPYEYVEGNDYAGIDVEIAQAIADELGMELQIEDVEFGSIIGGVQSGKFDMGMAGITVTDERKQSVDFSNSYATGIQSVIVPEGSAIASVDDITSDMKIGVQQDTTGDIYASAAPEEGGYGEDAVIRYNKGADAVQALVSGKVDCVIIDNEPAKSFVEANEGLQLLDTAYAEEDYAICVSKDNADLLKKINDALDKLIADGTVQKIVDKYITAE